MSTTDDSSRRRGSGTRAQWRPRGREGRKLEHELPLAHRCWDCLHRAAADRPSFSSMTACRSLLAQSGGAGRRRRAPAHRGGALPRQPFPRRPAGRSWSSPPTATASGAICPRSCAARGSTSSTSRRSARSGPRLLAAHDVVVLGSHVAHPTPGRDVQRLGPGRRQPRRHAPRQEARRDCSASPTPAARATRVEPHERRGRRHRREHAASTAAPTSTGWRARAPSPRWTTGAHGRPR